jgi:hypothetical protein
MLSFVMYHKQCKWKIKIGNPVLKSYQNNAKGTGSASVFGFLTEAFFLCLRTAAEKNSFEDQVLQAAHGHWEIRNI